jgi:RNA polymerase sigma-70 factor (ECF subfamily)
MKSLALNMLGSVSDAEDAVQEAFLRAYRNRQSFRGGSALSTWLFRILMNICYDVGRARRSRAPEQALEGDEPMRVSSPGGDHPLRVALGRALESLSPPHREVFLLFDVEGYTHPEIARMLDIPEGTSKFRLFEARRHLKAMIQASRPAVAESVRP